MALVPPPGTGGDRRGVWAADGERDQQPAAPVWADAVPGEPAPLLHPATDGGISLGAPPKRRGLRPKVPVLGARGTDGAPAERGFGQAGRKRGRARLSCPHSGDAPALRPARPAQSLLRRGGRGATRPLPGDAQRPRVSTFFLLREQI